MKDEVRNPDLEAVKQPQRIDEVLADLSARAKVIVDGGYSQVDVMKSAFADLQSFGGMTGIVSIVTSGTLNANQIELAKRVALKILAVLGMIEGNKKGA